MGKGLILRTPVKEVVPVVAARQLLLAVHNTGEKDIIFHFKCHASSEDMCTKWDGPWCKNGPGVMLREYSFHSVTLIVWHCDINCEVWKWTQPLESDHGDDPARIHSSLFSSLHWPPSSITLYCARFCCTPFLSNPLFCILYQTLVEIYQFFDGQLISSKLIRLRDWQSNPQF